MKLSFYPRSFYLRFAAAFILTALMAGSAAAIETSLSGFGTLGYVRSNQPFAYQRFVDENGSFRRDSILGLQLDTQINTRWSATVQVTLKTSDSEDDKFRALPSWAFVSWRPNNDLIVRLGKLRGSSFMHAETLEVGTTYPYAQLPVEVYSTSPTSDLTGIAISKVWENDAGDVTLDSWYGNAKNLKVRFFPRERFLFFNRGPLFFPYTIKSGGIAAAFHRDEDTYRIAISDTSVRLLGGDGLMVSYPFVSSGSQSGYFKTDPSMPGPEIPLVGAIRVHGLTLGADVRLPQAFRLSAEYNRSKYVNVRNAGTGGGYIALKRTFGSWTPYLSWARLLSDKSARELYLAVNGNTVPSYVPNSDLINASQRVGSDFLRVYDQYTVALGTSFSLKNDQQIKVEWARLHVGDMSALLDAPRSGHVRQQGVNIFSTSYNFVF